MARKESDVVRELTITRLLKAPIDLVWEIWTDEKHVREWWGPMASQVPGVRGTPKRGTLFI